MILKYTEHDSIFSQIQVLNGKLMTQLHLTGIEHDINQNGQVGQQIQGMIIMYENIQIQCGIEIIIHIIHQHDILQMIMKHLNIVSQFEEEINDGEYQQKENLCQ